MARVSPRSRASRPMDRSFPRRLRRAFGPDDAGESGVHCSGEPGAHRTHPRTDHGHLLPGRRTGLWEVVRGGEGTTTGCGLAGEQWLARKDSNLRSPDPESNDPNRAREPISVLRSTSRAVCFGSVRRTLLGGSCAPAKAQVRQANSLAADRSYPRTDDDSVTSRWRFGRSGYRAPRDEGLAGRRLR
jgi:hypothetical protein